MQSLDQDQQQNAVSGSAFNRNTFYSSGTDYHIVFPRRKEILTSSNLCVNRYYTYFVLLAITLKFLRNPDCVV
jgi:hypothetical protein